MELLEERIRRDGAVLEGNILRVDSFLNHQMDPALFRAMGEEWRRRFAGVEVTKILTVEASGIGIACLAGEVFGVPVVAAKKSRGLNLSGEVYTSQAESFTHKTVNQIVVSRRYLSPEDKVLILDDFLATGAALNALLDIVSQAGAETVGVGAAIEKGFQPGGADLRARGIRVESLAIVDAMDAVSGTITFREQGEEG